MTDKPTTPKLPELEHQIDYLDQLIETADGQDLMLCNQIRNSLEWVFTYLENRRDYHKKRNTTQRREIEMLKEALTAKGIDVSRLEREAIEEADMEMLRNHGDIE